MQSCWLISKYLWQLSSHFFYVILKTSLMVSTRVKNNSLLCLCNKQYSYFVQSIFTLFFYLSEVIRGEMESPAITPQLKCSSKTSLIFLSFPLLHFFLFLNQRCTGWWSFVLSCKILSVIPAHFLLCSRGLVCAALITAVTPWHWLLLILQFNWDEIELDPTYTPVGHPGLIERVKRESLNTKNASETWVLNSGSVWSCVVFFVCLFFPFHPSFKKHLIKPDWWKIWATVAGTILYLLPIPQPALAWWRVALPSSAWTSFLPSKRQSVSREKCYFQFSKCCLKQRSPLVLDVLMHFMYNSSISTLYFREWGHYIYST